uniref:Uncharacterized protein n=1 Tax=Strongyloides venezuelensis TaxID=75913 RepID=A0A0K0F4H3_STRVS
MRLAISIVLFIIFKTLQCNRPLPAPPLPPHYFLKHLLAFSGVFFCNGVMYHKAKLSFGRKFFGFSKILIQETPITKGQFSMTVQRSQCRMSSCFLQVRHQCKISKPECFAIVYISLNINKYLRNKKNIYKSYNLGVQDLARHYKGQRLFCFNKTTLSFKRKFE